MFGAYMPAIPPRSGTRFRWWASIALLLTAGTPLAAEIPAPPPGVHPSPQEGSITVARLRNIQVYVVGDVVRPGAYQMSAAGTVLTGFYAAGGPVGPGETPREAAG